MAEIIDPNPSERYWMVQKTRIIHKGEWFFDTEEEARQKASEVQDGKCRITVEPPEPDWLEWEKTSQPPIELNNDK